MAAFSRQTLVHREDHASMCWLKERRAGQFTYSQVDPRASLLRASMAWSLQSVCSEMSEARLEETLAKSPGR